MRRSLLSDSSHHNSGGRDGGMYPSSRGSTQYGSSPQYGSNPQYGSKYDTSSHYSSSGQYGTGLSSSGRYNTNSSTDRYGGTSSYGTGLVNDRDINYNRPDSSSSYTRETPNGKDYSRASARDSLYGSSSNMYSKDRRGSTYADIRDNDIRYESKDSGYGSRDKEVSSYNREYIMQSKGYDSHRKDSTTYGRDIYGGRDKSSRLKDDTYSLSRHASARSDYLDDGDMQRAKAESNKGKKKKRKNPITCNLSGTRYDVGRLSTRISSSKFCIFFRR